ncbi:hypothetical protein JOL79_03045 [Microbispora sp. RL4-1S]|uniref:Glycosyltransferase n=1 Tax=Microbispora oryzae TaxID=2806554 RepID=A0A941AI42_9ACTN|nr:hypothetical protein [Microbispora oryzae]MBP2702778.1 hypothetical protein [Microbispora oryzae]
MDIRDIRDIRDVRDVRDIDEIGDIRISVAVMHHPRRADRLPRLVRSCAPLRPRVVTDPDPSGPPSPLRTAKRAWAAVAPGATHHLVLQDDVTLTPGFAGLLNGAVAQRPRHAIALYSNWNSPQNSYHVRRAAAAGSPWAPLSPAEWTPTQGLVLPADQARELAEFLAPIPDAIRDDDEMVALFCAERGIRPLATVPHLVDHADEPTLAGHAGSFHATVYADGQALPPGHWTAGPGAEEALGARSAHRDAREFVVELIRSRCMLRFVRPGSGEPVEHGFGWYWADWASVAGIDPARVRDEFHAYARRDGVGAPYAPEVWAAGYLLGADAAASGAAGTMAGTVRARLLRDAVGSWIDSGLRPADRLTLGPAGRAALTELGVAAVERGRAATRLLVRA